MCQHQRLRAGLRDLSLSLQQSQLSKSASWAEERRGGLGVLCPLPALVPFQGTALARSLSPSLALGTRALRSLLH